MKKNEKMNVQGTEVVILDLKGKDYICITDIARHKNFKEPKDVIKNWMRSRGTIEFLALWEKINTPISKGTKSPPFCTNPVAMLLR